VVRPEAIVASGHGSVSARAASRSTSHSAGTSGTAKRRIACAKFIAGKQPGGSGRTVGAQEIASVMLPLRQRDGNNDVKHPKRLAKTGILVSRKPPAARGHAAKIILKIYAAVLGAMKRHASPIEHPLAIVEMIAARQSVGYAIVSASG